MKAKACTFSLRANEPERYVDYHLTLSADEYTRVDHSFFVDTGSPAGGRVDNEPAVYRRVAN